MPSCASYAAPPHPGYGLMTTFESLLGSACSVECKAAGEVHRASFQCCEEQIEKARAEWWGTVAPLGGENVREDLSFYDCQHRGMCGGKQENLVTLKQLEPLPPCLKCLPSHILTSCISSLRSNSQAVASPPSHRVQRTSLLLAPPQLHSTHYVAAAVSQPNACHTFHCRASERNIG